MNKIVIKTALVTLGTVIALFVLAFGIASLAFPRNMSEICENMGNYQLAASYAKRQYEYTDSTEDLYRCARLYIKTNDRENTIKYCEKLVNKKDFKEYCGAHVQYVYGNYATALYLSGNDDGAVAIAEKSVEDGFVISNAYVTLTLQADAKEDKEFAGKLLSSLEKIEEPQNEAQLKDYNAVKTILEKLTGDKT